jgi:hypothetical protein
MFEEISKIKIDSLIVTPGKHSSKCGTKWKLECFYNLSLTSGANKIKRNNGTMWHG